MCRNGEFHLITKFENELKDLIVKGSQWLPLLTSSSFLSLSFALSLSNHPPTTSSSSSPPGPPALLLPGGG